MCLVWRHNWHGKGIQTRDLVVESPRSHPLSHNSSSKSTLKKRVTGQNSLGRGGGGVNKVRNSAISSDTSYRYRHSGYFSWDAHFRSGRIPRCAACMHAMQSLYLSRRGQQTQHEFLISLHRRPLFFFFFLVLHRFISLFNSARLLTLSSWISRCVRRQHTCICTAHRMPKSVS